MNASKLSSGWRWLSLCVAVLLAHLWALQAVQLNLAPAQDAKALTAQGPLAFDTRTIAAPTPLTPARAQAVAKRKPQARPKPAPAQPAATAANIVAVTTQNEQAPEPLAAADAKFIVEPAPANDVVNKAAPDEVQASAPEQAASAPETINPKPPRERPLRVSAEALSGSVRLIYVVNTSKFPYRLSSELLWRNHGDTYSTLLRYSAFGQARVQTSRGRIGELGLAPERFSDKYRSEVAAHFNYPEGKVTFSANTPDAPLLAGAQDRLSILIQLGAYLASEPERFATGVTLTIPTVGPRDANLWLFSVVGTEALTLPDGTIDSVKLERLPREPYDQKVELWLSPQLSYLPARIRITEANGDSIDQQWQATEAAGEAD